MKIRFAAAALVAATLLLTPTVAGAGRPPGTLTGTPNPATVGDTVTVSNTADDASTCQTGLVNVIVMDPASAIVEDTVVTPDQDGNWSYEFTATATGTWMVNADCFNPCLEGLAGPAQIGCPTVQGAFPEFSYGVLSVLVQAPGTTVSTAATSTTVTPTTAAAAATATPAFTG